MKVIIQCILVVSMICSYAYMVGGMNYVREMFYRHYFKILIGLALLTDYVMMKKAFVIGVKMFGG